jgi:putative membrane protein
VSPRVLGLHHALKSAILLGFAMYIAYLVKTDKILLYIAPRMVDYVKWSAIALYAVAVYQIYQTIRTFRGRTAADCDCEHDHTPSRSVLKNTVIYGLFFLPLLLGFVLPDSTMGTSLAAKKGMNLSSAGSVKKDSAAGTGQAGSGGAASGGGSAAAGNGSAANGALSDSEMFPADKFTQHYAKYAKELYQSDVIAVKEDMYMETLTTVDLYLDRFVGKKLQMTGFVYRQDEMKDNQFVVGRFSIQCCSADAAPFGVLAEYDRAKTFPNDSWVTVTGTIEKGRFNDMDIMVLKLEKVAKAEPAKTPYVYPNYEFGA